MLPKNELYGLTSQTRAGFSIVANIARICEKGRTGVRALLRHRPRLTHELEVALRLARDRGYMTPEHWAKVEAYAITRVF